MHIVKLSNIKKTYPMGKVSVHAVNGIDLAIDKSDFVVIAGPSGAGKTTIMNIIGLIDKPSSGQVEIEGQITNNLSDIELTKIRHEYLGFIFQSFNLIPILNVFENIELPLLLGKRTSEKGERKEWVNYLLKEVGLANWRQHRPSELSGGQRQRVAIARALANKPQIVIADEPTANLDSKTGTTIINLMKKINKEQKTTFIFSTHDIVIREMADHVIQLQDGKIISEVERTKRTVS